MKTLKKLLFVSIVSSFFITGCMSTIKSTSRTIQRAYSDTDITHHIYRKLYAASELRQGNHVVVTTFSHTVLLTGEVSSPRQRTEIERIAQQVAGVDRIYNEISIAGQTSALTRSSDSWITTKIKSQLIIEKHVRANNIKVVTENGTVFLMGNVNSSQADSAVEIARRVAGVQRVVKLFSYAN